MSKTLVTYFSQTDNTKKIAEAIYAAIPANKEIKAMRELAAEEFAAYELIFIGFPVHSHSVPYAVEKTLKSVPAGKKLALFSTHGSLAGGRLSREALEYASVLTSQAQLLGSFSCRGKVSPPALLDLERSPEHKAWAEMAVSAATHPDESDAADAAAFANWILTLAAQN